jgi:hypothetical protein
MRFYFNFQDGALVLDNRGSSCETLKDVRIHARAIAAELGRNQQANKIRYEYVVVTDEMGSEVYRTSLINLQRTVKAEEIDQSVF